MNGSVAKPKLLIIPASSQTKKKKAWRWKKSLKPVFIVENLDLSHLKEKTKRKNNNNKMVCKIRIKKISILKHMW